jgi:hypothetical protein
MIYLFNSAYRRLYIRNVLNTLFLPPGSTNEYRYRVQGDGAIHIAPDSYNELRNTQVDHPIVIIFIDRFSTSGYSYHPLRIGKFVQTREEGDRLFFRVRLYDYIYPRDKQVFNTRIVDTLGPLGLPKLTNNDPSNTNDGYYAIKAGSIFSEDAHFVRGDDAWVSIIDQLCNTAAFSRAAELRRLLPGDEGKEAHEFIFAKCSVIAKGTDDTELSPRLQNNESVFNIVRGRQHKLRLTYRYPTQLEDTMSEATIEAEFGENLRPTGGTRVSVNSYSNSVDLPFTTKRVIEDYEDGIRFQFKPTNENRALIAPDTRLLVHIGESRLFWPQVIVGLLLFTVLGTIVGADFSDISPLTFCTVTQVLWPKFLASFFQALALLWLFRLVGTKPV